MKLSALTLRMSTYGYLKCLLVCALLGVLIGFALGARKARQERSKVDMAVRGLCTYVICVSHNDYKMHPDPRGPIPPGPEGFHILIQRLSDDHSIPSDLANELMDIADEPASTYTVAYEGIDPQTGLIRLSCQALGPFTARLDPKSNGGVMVRFTHL